jgi:hypothetical protein
MTAPDPTQGQPATAAAAQPQGQPAPAQPQGQLADGAAPEKPVPYFRFAEVNTARAAAEARAQAAEARAAELERKAGRLELRADLGIDDDDDADRVLSAYEKAHADVKADKRPKARDWVRAEGVLDTLPKSIRAAYGAQWVTQAQGQPAAAPRQPAPQTAPATPATSRGAQPTPSTAPKGDPAAALTPEQRATQWRRINGR